MRILQVNKFFYHRGGAEYIFFDTARLLQKNGHTISFFSMKHPKNLSSPFSNYFVSNIDFEDTGFFFKKLKIAGKILYSFEAKKKLERLLDKEKPVIAHLHNIYHQISPSILPTLKKRGIPVVMTLHDYKMICPVYTLLAKGRVCERCKDSRYYWCFVNRCTKNSYLKSAVNVVEMYLHHKVLHLYKLVDLFITPSRFLKDKLKEMGFRGRIEYLPNFVTTADFTPSFDYKEKAIYYAGRLSEEKGLSTLIKAVKNLDVQLKIIGDGPLKSNLEKKGSGNTHFLGYMPLEELNEIVKYCMGMVIPSKYYENNPRSVLEAFSIGKPVIAARVGGIPEIVKDRETGFLFEPGNIEDLRDKIGDFINNPMRISEMGRNARKFVEENFNSEKYYQELIKFYQMVMEKN